MICPHLFLTSYLFIALPLLLLITLYISVNPFDLPVDIFTDLQPFPPLELEYGKWMRKYRKNNNMLKGISHVFVLQKGKFKRKWRRDNYDKKAYLRIFFRDMNSKFLYRISRVCKIDIIIIYAQSKITTSVFLILLKSLLICSCILRVKIRSVLESQRLAQFAEQALLLLELSFALQKQLIFWKGKIMII